MYSKIKFEDNLFICVMDDGSIKEAGPNIRGMIKYTYFEETNDYPPEGWEVLRELFLRDYNSKIFKDFQSGKLQNDIKEGKITITPPNNE